MSGCLNIYVFLIKEFYVLKDYIVFFLLGLRFLKLKTNFFWTENENENENLKIFFNLCRHKYT